VPEQDVTGLIAVERRRAADLFASLTDEQLDSQSLCAQWSVRDIAAHLIGPFVISVPRFLAGSLVSGSMHRFSARETRRLAQRPIADIVATLRANASTPFAPPGTGPLAPLADLAVHTRDAARPLGLNATATPRAWRATLDFLASARAGRGFVRRGRLTGLRLTATDLDWTAGGGAEIRGPGEALALAVTGRTVALADLTGEGVATLRARLA